MKYLFNYLSTVTVKIAHFYCLRYDFLEICQQIISFIKSSKYIKAVNIIPLM